MIYFSFSISGSGGQFQACGWYVKHYCLSLFSLSLSLFLDTLRLRLLDIRYRTYSNYRSLRRLVIMPFAMEIQFLVSLGLL